jgi:hypothetical protein
VVQLCDGLPLALRLAAARLAAHPAWSIAGFAARLAEPRARLELLAGDDLSMRASLRAAVGLLERFGQQEAISCLRRLGALDLAVVDTEAVGALLERSPVGGELVAEQLVDVGLAHALSIGCYLIPGLTRIYARELPGGDPAADAAAVRRVVEHCRAEAAGQLATLDHERSGAAGPTRAQVSAWFRRKRATLTLLAARDGTDELSKLVTQLRAAVTLAR